MTNVDLGPRKSALVIVIVVACFAVLVPKVFYPMLLGSADQHMRPSPIDRTTGCCDVISETDVNTLKVMTELCDTILQKSGVRTGGPAKLAHSKDLVQRCRKEVLSTCGIDIAAVLQEQIRLGRTFKQILDEVRSFNGSLCLKYQFGVAPWSLGVPHRITVNRASAPSMKQERPSHLRPEMLHPALREKGRAIPVTSPPVRTSPPPRIVEGRPGPIPGMRPTMGGPGHIVPPPQKGSNIGMMMSVYTVGIVIFFTYTLIKLLFKGPVESKRATLYPPVQPDKTFRKEVFESEQAHYNSRFSKEVSTKLAYLCFLLVFVPLALVVQYPMLE